MTGAKKIPQHGAHRAEGNADSYPRLKSTAIAAQHALALQLLRAGKRSTFALRAAGILMPAARILELKRQYGYDIPTVERVDLWDAEGVKHQRIAVYELQGEPERAA